MGPICLQQGKNGDKEQNRRYNVIDGYYLANGSLNKNRLAKRYHFDSKIIDRDVKKAISDLTVMMFGID